MSTAFNYPCAVIDAHEGFSNLIQQDVMVLRDGKGELIAWVPALQAPAVALLINQGLQAQAKQVCKEAQAQEQARVDAENKRLAREIPLWGED